MSAPTFPSRPSMCAEPGDPDFVDKARKWAERAAADLLTETGTQWSDYHTRAATNWMPELCQYVVELADRLDQDRPEPSSCPHCAADVPRFNASAGYEFETWTHQYGGEPGTLMPCTAESSHDELRVVVKRAINQLRGNIAREDVTTMLYEALVATDRAASSHAAPGASS